MYQKTKMHGGLMAVCKVCSPDYKKKKRRGVDEPKRERVTTLEGYLKRVIAEEIGEEELTKDFRFQVMQKYGYIAPRIDRRVTKPSWMEISKWKTLKQEFHKMTTGVVPARQFSTAVRQQNAQRSLRTQSTHPSLSNRPKGR
jgi:hypothetical protein